VPEPGPVRVDANTDMSVHFRCAKALGRPVLLVVLPGERVPLLPTHGGLRDTLPLAVRAQGGPWHTLPSQSQPQGAVAHAPPLAA